MARYLPCLLVKNEGDVPVGGIPLVRTPGRRRGGWQMRSVFLVEDHAALVLDQKAGNQIRKGM